MNQDKPLSADPRPAPNLHELVRAAAVEAGALAMRWFRHGERTGARVWTKGKSSPVTEADVEVDAFLRRRLAMAGEEFGWLSEETVDSPERLACRFVFVVDPIDGTRAFVEGDPRWCVSIALVDDGLPSVAVVHAPALSMTHEASLTGEARLNGKPIRVSHAPSLAGMRVAGPRFLLDSLVAAHTHITPVAKIPSLAHRFCRLADGSLDAALASANANDWDIAAAHLIIERAGGKLSDLDGRVPRYNQASTIHGRLFAAPAGGFERTLLEVRQALDLPEKVLTATDPVSNRESAPR
ncbi:MAG: 3'(2'),5'-bisphosphate nucleotidase CysQ [Hyphomicrobiales bacterium]|nr:3'(2'),5'-bisphosphate nucleotidase CysQ [Hyphomicrobiales bacterium]MBV9752488.1 3'(2'),5'-bisphosphate nucleotidase CysQ [Hyphomicrobiales bacterium]